MGQLCSRFAKRALSATRVVCVLGEDGGEDEGEDAGQGGGEEDEQHDGAEDEYGEICAGEEVGEGASEGSVKRV